jgi:hypothetical protein
VIGPAAGSLLNTDDVVDEDAAAIRTVPEEQRDQLAHGGAIEDDDAFLLNMSRIHL